METLQEYFEFISTHLFTQGVQAVDPENKQKCLYRGPNNTKCAIGCIMPDEIYEPSFENVSIRNLCKNEKTRDVWKEKFTIVVDELEFFRKIQKIHDSRYNWETTENMKYILCHLGNEYKLSTEFLNNLSFKDR